MTEQQINELLEENHICAHCGGETKEHMDFDDVNDETYSYTVCTECGYEDH